MLRVAPTALVAALLLPLASALCSNSTCSQCSVSECNSVNGCRDDSPGDYDSSYCRSCGASCDSSEGDSSLLHLDPSEGCGLSDNLLAALIMGVLGGAFSALLPCACTASRKNRDNLRDFLNAPTGQVRRAQARVSNKYTKTSGNTEHRTTSYTLEIEFQAQRHNGTMVSTSGSPLVLYETYSGVEIGQTVEVAYRVGDERDFYVVPDAEARLKLWVPKIFSCVAGCFCLVGAAVGGAASMATSGCFVGIICWVVMVMLGASCGHFMCWKCSRRAARMHTSSKEVGAEGVPLGVPTV